MSLRDWAKFGWLKPHETDVRELSNLLAIADRDIADAAASELSNDWRFGIAYNAALKLCTMMLYDAGYMPEKNLAHYRTLLLRLARVGKRMPPIWIRVGPSGITSNMIMWTALQSPRRKNCWILRRNCARMWFRVLERSILRLVCQSRIRQAHKDLLRDRLRRRS